VANSIPQDTANKSYYPLAKITGVNASKNNPEPSVDVQQFHLVGNLGCNRFKVGQSTFYFQWYTV
jgi:heat shock protein HslJ